MNNHKRVKLGVDRFFEQDMKGLKNSKIGLLTNQTGANSNFLSTIKLFNDHPEVRLTALYAPEHGLLANGKEGERFSHSVHRSTKLPIYSLYGETKKPSDQMMEDVDVIVFDIQDIGARYYTYIYSMAHMMQACARTGKKMIVLDRPNPIGGTVVEGNLIDKDYTSFVGLYPIPNRHGMTVGELALFFNEKFNIHCDLEIVEMEGWKRSYFHGDTELPWIPPSPNTTTQDMMLLYPGTCLIEGTNLSEGRGTTQPFEIIGAPFIDGEMLQDKVNALGLENVYARSIAFTPTYQKYKDEYCEGIQLHLTNRASFQPVKTVISILMLINELYPKQFCFLKYGNLKRPMFDLLAGNDLLRKGILEGNIEKYELQSEVDTKRFKQQRQKYLLYR